MDQRLPLRPPDVYSFACGAEENKAADASFGQKDAMGHLGVCVQRRGHRAVIGICFLREKGGYWDKDSVGRRSRHGEVGFLD
jgi:hypothetical protein